MNHTDISAALDRMDALLSKLAAYNFECEAGSLHSCAEWQELRQELDRSRGAQHAKAVAEPTDMALRTAWRAAGGEFHGPHIETGTMPEAKLFPFLRSLMEQSPDAARFRSFAQAASEGNEAFLQAVDAYPDSDDGIKTVDDVRAMFDAGIAAMKAQEGTA